MMWESDVGFIPVVDDDQRLTGVVTDRDICMAASLSGKRLSELSVADTMSMKLIAARPDDSIERAARTMRANQIRRLPVIDDGKLVGVLSLNDLARISTGLRAKVRPKSLAETMAAICAPRPTSRAA